MYRALPPLHPPLPMQYLDRLTADSAVEVVRRLMCHPHSRAIHLLIDLAGCVYELGADAGVLVYELAHAVDEFLSCSCDYVSFFPRDVLPAEELEEWAVEVARVEDVEEFGGEAFEV